MNDIFLIAVVIFSDTSEPDCFLIPAKAWKKENDFFKYRAYDKPGQTSTPEYGLNVSRKNLYLLKDYKFNTTVNQYMSKA
jgi:hypothetical protein